MPPIQICISGGFMLIKIHWNLKGITLEKAGVPEFLKVPHHLRALTLKKLKKALMKDYGHPISKIEILYKEEK